MTFAPLPWPRDTDRTIGPGKDQSLRRSVARQFAPHYLHRDARRALCRISLSATSRTHIPSVLPPRAQAASTLDARRRDFAVRTSSFRTANRVGNRTAARVDEQTGASRRIDTGSSETVTSNCTPAAARAIQSYAVRPQGAAALPSNIAHPCEATDGGDRCTGDRWGLPRPLNPTYGDFAPRVRTVDKNPSLGIWHPLPLPRRYIR